MFIWIYITYLYAIHSILLLSLFKQSIVLFKYFLKYYKYLNNVGKIMYLPLCLLELFVIIFLSGIRFFLHIILSLMFLVVVLLWWRIFLAFEYLKKSLFCIYFWRIFSLGIELQIDIFVFLSALERNCSTVFSFALFLRRNLLQSIYSSFFFFLSGYF